MPGGHFRDKKICRTELNTIQIDLAGIIPSTNWLDKGAKVFKLETEMKEIYDYIGVPEIKEIKNKSKHHDYKLYYDDELRDEIGKLYAHDVNTFNYTF